MSSARSHLRLIPPYFVIPIIADQVTKYIATLYLYSGQPYSFFGGLVRLEYVLNPYGFLNSFAAIPEQARSFILTYGVLFFILLGLYFISTTRKLKASRKPAAYLILAGGASNLLDRFVHEGAVIDFLQVGQGIFQTGIFNLADMFILLPSFYLGYILTVYGFDPGTQ